VNGLLVEFLQSMPIWLTGIVVVGGFLAISLILGNFVVLVPIRVREQHNELAGFILAVVGVIYAVLLAFVAVGVWERFNRAEERTYQEATNLTIVYRDAGSFSNGPGLRAALRDYVRDVIEDEWPEMQKGGRSVSARLLLESVDRDVRNIKADTPERVAIQERMLEAMDAALEGRDARISEDATGINGVMWVTLIVGAFVTVGFTFLFGFKHTIIQQLMVGSLSILIGLMLFLIVALDFPFRGGMIVSPEAFENAQWVFRTIGQ
jgi:Protein of unknown function (DUF4239)